MPGAGAGGRGQQRDLEQLTGGGPDCRGPLGFRNLPWNIHPAASVPPQRPLSFLTTSSRCPKRPPCSFLEPGWSQFCPRHQLKTASFKLCHLHYQLHRFLSSPAAPAWQVPCSLCQVVPVDSSF